MAADGTGTVQVEPLALVTTADVVRESADAIGSIAFPIGIQLPTLADLEQLRHLLTEFEQGRSRRDSRTFEALRAAAELLAVIAVDAIRADNTTFVPMPDAGY